MFKKTLAIACLNIAGILAATSAAADAGLRAQAQTFFKPLPESMPGAENDSPALISLGEKLYFETALSINGEQSCNSCHQINNQGAGVDNNPTSPGALEGRFGNRNSPSVFNAGFHVAQFWDGRAADLKEQAKGPILNPVEMAVPDEATAVKRLRKAGYEDAFAKAFPGEDSALNYDNVAAAIAAFERTLITRDRFDEFLKGNDTALNAQEKQGLKTFISTGCIACHSGALLGGSMYQKMGSVHPYANTEDKGREELTGKASDRYVFKVPSLRDISRTAPYFHDGAVATLDEAVKQMAWLQLGRELSDADTASIVAFLNALENTQPVTLAQAK